MAFEEFQIEEGLRGRSVSELKGQMWLVAGILMIVIGVNLYGVDGSVEIYKVNNDDYAKIREQVDQRKEDLEISLYYQSLFSSNGTGGVRVETIEASEIMF